MSNQKSSLLTAFSRQPKTKLQTAIDAVIKAMRLCERVQAEMVPTDAIQKTDRSPVTVADFGSQALICKAIGDAFPDDPIVAEESAQALKENASLLERVADYVHRFCEEASPSTETVCEWIDRGSGEVGPSFWTLDPIDGTKGFLRRDQYAVALAYIVNGTVQLGVLGCPTLPHRLNDGEAERGCLFVATRGEGTRLYTKTGDFIEHVHVSETIHRFAESVESTHGDSDAHSNIANALGITESPVRMDSQAKYGIVSRGEASLYIRLPNPAYPDYRECIWDHAAGLIVVEEAGGTVTDANGTPLNFLTGKRMQENRGIIATNGTLHQHVLKTLAKL
ncbi:MAG: 3'(2'),5'-bisphosphate nucleotidase [Candidatus Poribacteria bacterium]|nr:3'(2'),5'-bisphosphate nucleotidase [Candidatus Poribacteria bacterium]